jgi:hypothetical protein
MAAAVSRLAVAGVNSEDEYCLVLAEQSPHTRA